MTEYFVEGKYTLDPQYSKWAMPGWTGRYWDVIEAENEDDLAAYLAGQQPFEKPPSTEFEPIVYGQEVKRCYESVSIESQKRCDHTCARCKKPCKKPYKHCYRCNQYLKVKAKIA